MYASQKARKLGIFSSLVAIVVCVILITGSTFSLFTGGTNADISISAGQIKVEANIENLKLSSLGVAQTGDKFANGGIAKLEGNQLDLSNVTPGDRAEFDIIVKNTSSVSISYAITWAIAGNLADYLTVTVDNAPFANGTTDWNDWLLENKTTDVKHTVAIELPKNINNDAMGLSATIDFDLAAVQYNAVDETVQSGDQLDLAVDYCDRAILANDVTLKENLVIPAGKTFTIYLGNYTIDTNDFEIVNNGTLFIEDVASQATVYSRRAASAAGSILGTIVNNGTLTVTENTTVETIENAGTATIEGATVATVENSGTATIAGATVATVNNAGSVAIEDATVETIANAGTATIAGATVANIDNTAEAELVINNATVTGSITADESADITINDGNFAFDLPTEWLGDELVTVENEDGSFGIASKWVAAIGEVQYTSVQDAIDAAEDGATITILRDVAIKSQNVQELVKKVYNREFYAGLVIPDDKAITLDLNGKAISYVDSYGDIDNVMILNLGKLTVNDSAEGGKISYTPVPSTSSYSKFYSTVFNCGTMTVNSGTIENLATAGVDSTDAIDNHSRLSHEYGNDCLLTVNGGTITGGYYYSIRLYTHYSEGVKNRVTINNGVLNNGIYAQHGESWYYPNPANNRLNVDMQVVINGGTFNNVDPDALIASVRFRLANPDNQAAKLEINGGTFNSYFQLQIQRGVYYTNGVSGATTPAEATGARNAEWLAANGTFIKGGKFLMLEKPNGDDTTNLNCFINGGDEFVANDDGYYTYLPYAPDTTWYDESTDEFVLTSARQLAGLAVLVNEGKATDVTIKLGCDIDITGINWVAIGNEDYQFEGTFDGCNYTIKGLTANSDGEIAFFYYLVSDTIVKDVNFSDVNVNGKSAGVVSVYMSGGSIENVHVLSGSVTGTNYAASFVAVQGYYGASIKNCTNYANITSNFIAAGFGGYLWYDSNIENCVNYGNVTGANRAGGIAAHLGGTVTGCTNNGEIIGNGGMGAGGIVAVLSSASTIENCVNNGNVTNNGTDVYNSLAGGILGVTPGSAVTIKNCTNNGNITAKANWAAGIASSHYGSLTVIGCENKGAVIGATGAYGVTSDKGMFSGTNVATDCIDNGTATVA